MNWGERLEARGDRIEPPDDLGMKLRTAAGAVTFAIRSWFVQTGNPPAACTFTPTVTPTAKTLTITLVIQAP